MSRIREPRDPRGSFLQPACRRRHKGTRSFICGSCRLVTKTDLKERAPERHLLKPARFATTVQPVRDWNHHLHSSNQYPKARAYNLISSVHYRDIWDHLPMARADRNLPLRRRWSSWTQPQSDLSMDIQPVSRSLKISAIFPAAKRRNRSSECGQRPKLRSMTYHLKWDLSFENSQSSEDKLLRPVMLSEHMWVN